MTKLALPIVAFAALIILVASVIFFYLVPEAWGEWLSALLGTLIGALLAAVVGIWLFNQQTKEIDKRRRRQLLEAWAGELQAILDILEAKPIQVPPPAGSPNSEKPIGIMLAHLDSVVSRESMRNAVNDSKDTMALSHFVREIEGYNTAVERFQVTRWGPSLTNHEALLFTLAKDVKRRQDIIIEWCRANTKMLEEEEGIEIPPRHYSKEKEEG
jgi:hypothetical protein